MPDPYGEDFCLFLFLKLYSLFSVDLSCTSAYTGTGTQEEALV